MIDDQQFAKKIKGYLDQATVELKAGTAYRLQQARAHALARLTTQPARAPEAQLAHATGSGGVRTAPGASIWRNSWLWLGIVAIVVAGFGFQQWELYQQTRELVELDAQLLTSDLPIDAYLDRGFQTWLSRPEP